ncbi:ATP-dependent RNA helicase [Trichinella pseudospiralis]
MINVSNSADSGVADANVENEPCDGKENKEICIKCESRSCFDSDSTVYDDLSDSEIEKKGEDVEIDMKKGNYLPHSKPKLFIDGDTDRREFLHRLNYHRSRRDYKNTGRRRYRGNGISANQKKLTEKHHYRRRGRKPQSQSLLDKVKADFGEFLIADFSIWCSNTAKAKEKFIKMRQQAKSAKVENEQVIEADEIQQKNKSPGPNKLPPTNSVNDNKHLMADSFQQYGFDNALLDKLKKLKIEIPTKIQRESIPVLLSHDNLVCCGLRSLPNDALAYLLPIISELFHRKGIGNKVTPQAVIVASLAKSVTSIFNLCNDLLSGTELCCVQIFGDTYGKEAFMSEAEECDILIATSRCLVSLLKREILNLNYCRFFIFDEIDNMLAIDQERYSVRYIASVCPEVEFLTAAFCSSFTEAVKTFVSDYMPDYKFKCVYQFSSNVVSQNNLLKFIKAETRKSDQFLALINDIVAEHPNKNEIPKIVVFVNKKRVADSLTMMLLFEGFRAISIHGDRSIVARDEAVGMFTSGEVNVLVSTDIASSYYNLGVVDYLINYDMAAAIGNYIKRKKLVPRNSASPTCIITLLNPYVERIQLADLLKILDEADQELPQFLYEYCLDFLKKYGAKQYSQHSELRKLVAAAVAKSQKRMAEEQQPAA